MSDHLPIRSLNGMNGDKDIPFEGKTTTFLRFRKEHSTPLGGLPTAKTCWTTNLISA
jgi:hypothetical protein